ncbi:hypothetical protein C0995_000018 [Termitomyces sp. Mi166|nr:hypothetical protein C0995_000018 [Termitomyces sp. Mi166\
MADQGVGTWTWRNARTDKLGPNILVRSDYNQVHRLRPQDLYAHRMYRTAPISRRVAFTSRKGVVRVVRRHLTTDGATSATPKKRRSIVRRIFWYTAGLTGTFYVGSSFAAFYNQAYYDFFSDHVPLGQAMLEFAEANNWDTLTAAQVLDSGAQVLDSGKSAIVAVQRFVTDKISGSESPKPIEPLKRRVEPEVKSIKTVTVSKPADESKSAEAPKPADAPTSPIAKVVEKTKEKIHKVEDEMTAKTAALAKHEAGEVVEGLSELVQQAEAALKTSHVEPSPTSAPVPSESTPTPKETVSEAIGKPVYDGPIPIGFEPPPGFIRAAPPKESPKTPESAPLPLIAPGVSSIGVSEPIIAQLATTIDNLAAFVNANPAAAPKVADVLESAKTDLTALADRIEKAKEEERTALEIKLDEQTREYTQKLLEFEMEAQDKLDSQEDDFRKFFDQEKQRLVQAYHEKLHNELQTQTELINERLKEEVVAQGIELQRRWIRDIKIRVEQERGGRLGKLEELASQLKRLERVALDNSNYLDENIRIHALWSAVRALNSCALTSQVRKPFREELRFLRHVANAREDPVVMAALESLESSEVPDVGVEPFADLASWFSSDVAPKMAHVALVPDQNAGVLSYLASQLFSGLRFRRQGLVAGNDVLSVIAKAEYYLNEKDLDSAARELNQLDGAAKVLVHDWLEAARRRLEVEQALEVVQAQATFASLLVV